MPNMQVAARPAKRRRRARHIASGVPSKQMYKLMSPMHSIAPSNAALGLCHVWKVGDQGQSIRRTRRPRPEVLGKVKRITQRHTPYYDQAISMLQRSGCSNAAEPPGRIVRQISPSPERRFSTWNRDWDLSWIPIRHTFSNE